MEGGPFNEDDNTTSSAVLALTQLEFRTLRPHSTRKFAVFPTAATGNHDDERSRKEFSRIPSGALCDLISDAIRKLQTNNFNELERSKVFVRNGI